jgi:flavin-dependent dehydrogenase
VIGGGPAGSTAAALLARQGRHVVLLEKDAHPRFHIGESLLPANMPLFEELGVADEIAAVGMQKWGATFVSPWHDHTTSFKFADATDPNLPLAYQVRRSEFDEILFRRARALGAEAYENTRVREFTLGGQGELPTVKATSVDGTVREWRARFLLDCTGRDTLVANRLKVKRRNPAHNSSAMYGHFRNARRECGDMEGNIIIFWFDHGWFWFIPLKDGVTSIGAVVWPYYMKNRDKPVRDWFMETIARCPELADRLKDAELISEPEATGNYSYSCDHCQGENYLLLGDAFAFIDPVFSSGVMLAMNSAFEGVKVAEARLAADRAAEAAARKRFDFVMREGPKQFSWFIYRVTNPTMRDLFMSPSDRWDMKKALLSVLAGDVFGRTPIRKGLRLFRLVYYVFSLIHLRRSLRAWRRRAFNIRDDSHMRLSRG